MEILLKVLEELHYSFKTHFTVENVGGSYKNNSFDVKILISEENNSQVFLVIECLASQLVYFVGDDVIKNIATKFRKNEFHRAEMDKNTTLLLICKNENNEIDFSSKVKIEDDPYYFKKYVFSYDDLGLMNAEKWLNEKENNQSLITNIQEYITDTNNFARFKEKDSDESIYPFFIELVTKLHCFPMKIVETKEIIPVKDFLYDYISNLKKKTKKPIYINAKKIETFLELDIDFEDVDEICTKWNLLSLTESEVE